MSSLFSSQLTPSSPFGSPTSSPSAGPGGGGSDGSGMNLANSASLYLYTFLATLVLLLSVSGAIVIRSFVLRRRHRRSVEEAIRNGTWVPPTPPVIAARVDLSQKPELWEAYLGGGGWQAGGLGHGSGKETDTASWKFEYSKEWDAIKPISTDYVTSQSSVPYSGSTPNLTSLSPPVPISVPRAPPTEDEENQRTAEVSTTPSLLTRARMFLNQPLPTLPTSSTAADSGTNSHSANISMTELNSNSPKTARVTVLIAMPSLSSHGSCTPACVSCPSPLSSSKPQSTASHPLESSCSSGSCATGDEQPLPHLEMGVAEIVISPSEKLSSAHAGREGKITYSS